MNKLKINIIHYTDVFNSCNITPNYSHIEEYLNGGRQDILENFDIFTENVRSRNVKFKNFDSFEISDEITVSTVIVVGFYLELLEFWNQRNKIRDVINFYCKKYPNNKVVVTWNHDIDAYHIFTFINEFPNLYVLNFNTSINHDRFILLPFWTIDDELYVTNKKFLANLVCSFNNHLRWSLKETLSSMDDIFISSRIPYDEYKEKLSSSMFTLCPRGLGLSSYRFFECFHLNTIPVLFADHVILPYQNTLNYNEFIVRIKESKSNDKNYIIDTLNKVDYKKMLSTMNEVREYYTLKGVQQEINTRLSYDTSNNNTPRI